METVKIVAATVLLVVMLAGLTLFLAIFPMQAYAQTDKPPKNDEPSALVAPVAQKQSDSPYLQPRHQEHAQADVWVVKTPEKDGWDIAAFAVSVALLGIALFGVIYARQTLLAIEGQLAEIKAAGVQTDKIIANAGKHADAAINAARPFILVYTKGDLGTQFWMRNCGRSPAQLLHVDPILKFEYPRFDEAQQEWGMRQPPFYGKHYEAGEQINVAWLAPGERRCFATIDPNIFQDSGQNLLPSWIRRSGPSAFILLSGIAALLPRTCLRLDSAMAGGDPGEPI